MYADIHIHTLSIPNIHPHPHTLHTLYIHPSLYALYTSPRGPVQLCQPPKEGSDAHTAAHGGVRSPPRPLSDRGRTILQQLMREGLGDHVFYLRLYQVDVCVCVCRVVGCM